MRRLCVWLPFFLFIFAYKWQAKSADRSGEKKKKIIFISSQQEFGCRLKCFKNIFEPIHIFLLIFHCGRRTRKPDKDIESFFLSSTTRVSFLFSVSLSARLLVPLFIAHFSGFYTLYVTIYYDRRPGFSVLYNKSSSHSSLFFWGGWWWGGPPLCDRHTHTKKLNFFFRKRGMQRGQ